MGSLPEGRGPPEDPDYTPLRNVFGAPPSLPGLAVSGQASRQTALSWCGGQQGQPGPAGIADPLGQAPWQLQDLFGQQQGVLNGFQQQHQQHQQQEGPLPMPADLLSLAMDLAPSRPQELLLREPSGMQQQWQRQQAPSEQQPPPPPPQQQQQPALDKEAKQALARQKNREAQQRFRERQRAKLAEASVEYDKLSEEVERLRLENHTLTKQNGIMEKVLIVRDAMMRAFDEYKSLTNEEQVARMEQQTAEGLMQAIENLPTQQDMDEFATSSDGSRPQQQQQQHQQQQVQGGEEPRASGPGPADPAPPQASGGSSGGGPWCPPARPAAAQLAAAAAAAAPGQHPARAEGGALDDGGSLRGPGGGGEGRSTRSPSPDAVPEGPAGPIWAGIKSGSAAGVEIDGSVLGRAGSRYIPPPTNAHMVRRVQQMAQAQDLVDYWSQWKVEMARVYEAGNTAGWAEVHLKEADDVMTDIIQMWWHTAQLKPSFMLHLIEIGTRKNPAADDEVSRSIAAAVLPRMDAQALRLMRRAWQQYMRRLARAAIGMSRWVQRLRQLAGPTHVESMRSVACGAVEVMEIARHMQVAVEEEYLASMEFLANLTPALSQRDKLEINYMAAPYLPDWVQVAYHVLRLDSQQGGSGGGACSGAVTIQFPPAVAAPLQVLSAGVPAPPGVQLPRWQQRQQEQRAQEEQVGSLQQRGTGAGGGASSPAS